MDEISRFFEDWIHGTPRIRGCHQCKQADPDSMFSWFPTCRAVLDVTRRKVDGRGNVDWNREDQLKSFDHFIECIGKARAKLLPKDIGIVRAWKTYGHPTFTETGWMRQYVESVVYTDTYDSHELFSAIMKEPDLEGSYFVYNFLFGFMITAHVRDDNIPSEYYFVPRMAVPSVYEYFAAMNKQFDEWDRQSREKHEARKRELEERRARRARN